MRKPRDISRYRDAESVAKILESQASRIRRDAGIYPLIKYVIDIWNWNPEWADKPKPLKQASRRAGAASEQKEQETNG